MPRERFDLLKERLLRAGIAPRHVRRYVTELEDHFADLVREEVDRGSPRHEAEATARARIGNDNVLAEMMLARTELRSFTARYPWAAFGLGPVFILALVVAAALLFQGAFIFWSPPIPKWSVPWMKSLFDVINWLATYAAPLAIALGLCAIGLRQRTTFGWIVLGLSIICIVGGFHEIGVKWSSIPTQPSTLEVSFALAPPFPGQMITAGIYRTAINFVLVGTGYWLWLRQSSVRAEQ